VLELSPRVAHLLIHHCTVVGNKLLLNFYTRNYPQELVQINTESYTT
jgi:hypothetical protein